MPRIWWVLKKTRGRKEIKEESARKEAGEEGGKKEGKEKRESVEVTKGKRVPQDLRHGTLIECR